jgi:phosphopantothenoylcysteine synthetase/decarboxylase
MRPGVLYVVVCAAPPARDAGVLVGLAREAGWDTCVVVTPAARAFVDTAELEARSGHPVRFEWKRPGTPDILPPADAMVVAPATFNTINKWAAGISDTLALGLVCEAIGKRLALVALPFLNAAQACHPAFARSVAQLRELGVRVLWGEEEGMTPPGPPGSGEQRIASFPWGRTLDALAEQRNRPRGSDKPS